ncbi:MAG: chorismate mutase [Anaerolineales bacterium]|nr:chorismate mutase [Anaerolineales bacterium]
MSIRGIRGAITVAEDEAQAILQATCELLQAILAENDGLQAQDIASALFTVSDDLSAAFPAQAARELGWDFVPMICAREIPVPNSLPKTVRVLLHWNTETPQKEIKHVYLREAVRLRPDWANA